MIASRRNLLLGIATLAAALAFMVAVAITLVGGFGRNVYPVTVTFDRAGQLLKVTSDVKLRGVLVGRVSRIELTDEGMARVTLAMDTAQPVPANVTAAVRGKTLFGEKFIQLSVDDPSEEILQAGDEIPFERTVSPFELEQVLETGLPVLNAIEARELGKIFQALAEGFVGQEEAARRSIDQGLVALQALNARSADLDRLLAGLDDSSAALARAAPDLVAALRGLDAFNRAVLDRSFQASASLRDAPTWLDQTAGIMQARFTDLVDISVKGSDVLAVVAGHREALPFTVESLKNFTQAWVTNMSVGCTNPAGQSIDQVYPALAGSTCWQVWNLTAEDAKSPGGYDPGTRPTPSSAAAFMAFRAQVSQLQALPFGEEPNDLSLLIYSPLRDARGLLPEGIR